MRSRTRGIHDRSVAETPIAVFDFETTGLNPGYDRVIEVSVIRIDHRRPGITEGSPEPWPDERLPIRLRDGGLIGKVAEPGVALDCPHIRLSMS